MLNINSSLLNNIKCESTWKMHFIGFWFVLLLCGSTLAQDDGNSVEREETIEAQSYHADMDDLLSEFGAMTEKLKAMETRLKHSEQQIQELRNKERTKVVFSATIGTGGAFGPFDTDTTLIYRTVITNIGNAYNQSTGLFVAPVAGVYYFTIFFHAGGEHEAKLYLYKNSELMIMTHDHKSDSETADNGGNAVFLQLQQGDRVHVELAENCHVWASPYQTSFSGFLVSQM